MNTRKAEVVGTTLIAETTVLKGSAVLKTQIQESDPIAYGSESKRFMWPPKSAKLQPRQEWLVKVVDARLRRREGKVVLAEGNRPVVDMEVELVGKIEHRFSQGKWISSVGGKTMLEVPAERVETWNEKGDPIEQIIVNDEIVRTRVVNLAWRTSTRTSTPVDGKYVKKVRWGIGLVSFQAVNREKEYLDDGKVIRIAYDAVKVNENRIEIVSARVIKHHTFQGSNLETGKTYKAMPRIIRELL